MATPAVDVYSAGIVLYELAEGHPPFGTLDLMAVLKQHLSDKPPRPESMSEALWADPYPVDKDAQIDPRPPRCRSWPVASSAGRPIDEVVLTQETTASRIGPDAVVLKDLVVATMSPPFRRGLRDRRQRCIHRLETLQTTNEITAPQPVGLRRIRSCWRRHQAAGMAARAATGSDEATAAVVQNSVEPLTRGDLHVPLSSQNPRDVALASAQGVNKARDR